MKKNINDKKSIVNVFSYTKMIVVGGVLLIVGAGVLVVWAAYIWSSVFPGEGVEGIREASILQEQELRPVRPVEFTDVFSLGSETYRIFTADTDRERARGLSGSSYLPKGAGMLFIFEKEDRHGFWMKEMNYPIDIVWLDSLDRIVHIEKSVHPDTYPKVFYPDAPALKVLELPAGTL